MKLIVTMILAVCILFTCGPKHYSEFTLDRPARLAGQTFDPQGAVVANLRLVVKCGSSTYERITDGEGKYDFGVLPAGTCKIGTPVKTWMTPEVKCNAGACEVTQTAARANVPDVKLDHEYLDAETD
jgi:hypothetical protein